MANVRSHIPVAPSNLLAKSLFVLLGIIALGFSAKIAIPMIPVPMTLQTFVVLFIGMTYGWRLGGTTVALYCMLGLAGVPMLALAPLGATLGYLLGFIPAAVIAAVLVTKLPYSHRVNVFIAAIVGTVVILASGLTVLTYLMGLQQAIVVGLLPFIFAAVVKCLALVALVPRRKLVS